MDDPSIDELPIALQQPRGLSGPLLDLIARRIRTEAESTVESFNLRPRHVIALMLLQLLGEQSQSDLGEALRVDRTNLVGLLNDLEAAELIERRRSSQDRRPDAHQKRPARGTPHRRAGTGPATKLADLLSRRPYSHR